MDIEKKLYQVKNRSSSTAVYRIPEEGIRREFAPGEIKRITYGELVKLTYQPGGQTLLNSFLQVISEPEVRDDLGIHVEPEYDYSEDQIKDLILTGSRDAFLDCLDFAPAGVIDLIKQFSVSLPITDTVKIKALKDKTGFDAIAAIANTKDDETEEKVEGATRRVAPITAEAKPVRRTESKYTIISQ